MDNHGHYLKNFKCAFQLCFKVPLGPLGPFLIFPTTERCFRFFPGRLKLVVQLCALATVVGAPRQEGHIVDAGNAGMNSQDIARYSKVKGAPSSILMGLKALNTNNERITALGFSVFPEKTDIKWTNMTPMVRSQSYQIAPVKPNET